MTYSPALSLLLVLILVPLHAQERAPELLESGVTFRVYDIGYPMDRLYPLLEGQTPNVDQKRDVIDYPARGGFGGFSDHFRVEVLGWIRVPSSGLYRFRLTSDDGSALWIGGQQIIRHDGVHPATSKDGKLELSVGDHEYRVSMFENGGGEHLTLSWQKPGDRGFSVVPAQSFFVEKGVTRVVSPGLKRMRDGRLPMKPGHGLPLRKVHPSWELEKIRPDGFEPQVGGMDFLPDGRLVLTSFKPLNNGVFRTEPNGTLYLLSNLDDRSLAGAVEPGVVGPDAVEIETIASDLHDPLGVVCVGDDIYVCDRNAIHLFADRDGDGAFEHREVVVNDWISDNYHHFTFGLVHQDGYLYGSLSTSIYFENTMKRDEVKGAVVSMNGPNPPHRGTCWRVSLETRKIEYLAGGFRTPNGIGAGPEGEIFVADNQGAWLPASKLIHVQTGAFYGHYNGTQKSKVYPDGGNPSLFHDQPVSPPAVWLPQNECANSPAQPLLLEEGEFAGQMLLAEITTGGIRRIALERVNGVFQGAVFRYGQGFECGLNRMAFGPDGCLYVGGTGSGGNWSWRNRRFGLERLRPTTHTVFEYHSIVATADGFELRFTRPVERAWLETPENYRLDQWHYVPTAQYGGRKHDERRLSVIEATASGDRRSVRLRVAGLRRGSVVHIRSHPESESGEAMWSSEAWYTLNEIPTDQARNSDRLFQPLSRPTLASFRAERGEWQLVGYTEIDPSNPRRLRSGPSSSESAGHVAWNGERGRTAHLVTDFDHGDAEVHVEFMIPEGSNSGVYFMGRYEIQILDSFGRKKVGPGDCGGVYQRWDPSRGKGKEGYAGVSPRVNATGAPGTWQTFDIIFRAPRFDAAGRKVRNARFERVIHNGVVIHEDVEVGGPTRGAMFDNEKRFGPLSFQGDHGPVAYRNLKIKTLD